MILTKQKSDLISSEIKRLINTALKSRRLSARQASIDVVGHDGLIRDIRAGRMPSVDRLQVLFNYLDLDFHFGGYLDKKQALSESNSKDTFTQFSPGIDFPVRGYAKCSITGYLEKEQKFPDLPMPVGVKEHDATSFYVIAMGRSMQPEGINQADYCLVSPATPLSAGARVWLKNRQGQTVMKRVLEMDEKTITLRGWQHPLEGGQKNFDDQWMKSNIAEQGVILAVWRGKPDVANPPKLIPDPKATPEGKATEATLPQEIATLLDLPEGASLQEAAQAIESLASTAEKSGAGAKSNIPEIKAKKPPRTITNIPYAGDISAGGEGFEADDQIIALNTDIEFSLGILQVEPEIWGGLQAFMIKGRCLEPDYGDRDILFAYKDDQLQYNMEALIGKDCLVTLGKEHDNVVLLKCLRRPDNNRSGYFNLESLNPFNVTMINAPVKLAIPVRHIHRNI